MMHTTFLEDLQAAGVAPESVDVVLCTHLHVDHVGWNTRLDGDRWVPTFPRARYLFARREWEHWSAEREPDTARIMADSVTPILEAGLATLVEADHRISDEIWLEPTPGHTPGHVSVRLRGRDGEAVITRRSHAPSDPDRRARVVQPLRRRPRPGAQDAPRLLRALRRSSPDGARHAFPPPHRGAHRPTRRGVAVHRAVMVKLVFCVKRLPHLSREDFQKYWRDRHGPLVREAAPALAIRRYVQTHTAATPLNERLRGGRGAPEEYDGVAELWFDSIEALVNAGGTPEGRAAGKRLLEDERRFIDLARSPLWLAEEHKVI
jgi:uncharacterized protein (TIGR02118 family)